MHSELAFFSALIAMMNPVGNAGLFVSLTASTTRHRRTRVALVAGFAAALIGIVSQFAGGALLYGMHVSIDALRLAGGLFLLQVGLAMLRGESHHAHSADDQRHAEQFDDPSVVPVAMPLLMGPGAIALIISAAHQSTGIYAEAWMSSAILIASGLCAITFVFAGPLAERLGPAGLKIVTRLMGLVIAAIAVQMIVDGGLALVQSHSDP